MSEVALAASVDARVPTPARSATDVTAPPNQLISFAIGDDQYCVDIIAVREIKGWTAITPLPGQPEYVRGVLNLRGVIVPMCRFGHHQQQQSGEGRRRSRQ
jgi:purine-binding chemotaxis protein CheW